jgi:hypothetical protein
MEWNSTDSEHVQNSPTGPKTDRFSRRPVELNDVKPVEHTILHSANVA